MGKVVSINSKKVAKKAAKKTTKKKSKREPIPPKQRAKKPASKRKAKASSKTNGAPDAEEVRPAKITDENLKALEALRKQADNGDRDAIKALVEVVTNFGQWRQAKSTQQRVAKECKSLLEQDEGALGEAIEKPIPIGSVQETAEATQTKLKVVEQRWQELQDTKSATKEKKKDAKKSVSTWASKLDRSIQDSAQLTLGFG